MNHVEINLLLKYADKEELLDIFMNLSKGILIPIKCF